MSLLLRTEPRNENPARVAATLPRLALQERLAFRTGTSGLRSRPQAYPIDPDPVSQLRAELHEMESAADKAEGVLMEQPKDLMAALLQVELELHAWVRREHDKLNRRQNTIDDLKRRCGVITPEKS